MALTTYMPEPLMLPPPELIDPKKVWPIIRKGAAEQAKYEKDWEFKNQEPRYAVEPDVRPAESKHQPFNNRD